LGVADDCIASVTGNCEARCVAIGHWSFGSGSGSIGSGPNGVGVGSPLWNSSSSSPFLLRNALP
jgi:hypothetical protein